MRITVLRQRMAEEFGPVRADVLARDHVFSALGSRTVNEALHAGVSTKEIWRVVCTDLDVPLERR